MLSSKRFKLTMGRPQSVQVDSEGYAGDCRDFQTMRGIERGKRWNRAKLSLEEMAFVGLTDEEIADVR